MHKPKRLLAATLAFLLAFTFLMVHPIEALAEDIARYTVNFYDWDAALLSSQTIQEGEAASAPEVPPREGYRFTGWSEEFNSIVRDMDIVAQYEELESFTVTINYIFADNTLARQPVVFSVPEGGALSQTVETPPIAGFTPDQPSVTLNLAAVAQDYAYTVVYTPAGDTAYTIEHYLQNIIPANGENPAAPENFTLQDSESRQGQTASLVTATARDYPGFTAPAAMPAAQIAADGGTTLRVYYTRNQYAVYFDTAGGSYVAPVSALYGESLQQPEDPTRPGYSFDGWSQSFPDTMPAGDVTLTAGWSVAGTVGYTLVYWLENIHSTGYDYVGATLRAGAAGSAPVIPTGIPGDVSFPIATTYFARNNTKTNAELPAAIKGDGTTIVNVYYDRNSYSLHFSFNASKYSLTVNGATYTASPYTLTAKYGAPIDAVWPGTPTLLPGKTSDGYFVGWNGSSTDYVTQQFFMNDRLAATGSFSARWLSTSRRVTVNYHFQNLAGDGYTINHAQTLNSNSSATTWNSKTFDGFTVQQSSVAIPANGVVNFYYTRNKYSVTYYNGGEIAQTIPNVLYEADLSGFGIAANRPASVPEGYVFGGWYTTPEGYEGTGFAFAGATMPSNNLILYAKWVKPQYTVTFQPGNGEADFTQTVYALETIAPPAEPTRPGYVFGGWYLQGASTKYVFSFPVNRNMVLSARWIAQNNITYDVVYMTGAVEYQRLSYGGGSVGQSVTAPAITIEGYLPDALSKSLTLAASGNEIVFHYTPFTSTSYTVRYVGTNGEQLLDEETYTTSQASVTVNYKSIPGRYPNFYQQTLRLTPDAAANVITFVYTPNADVNYTVRVFMENVDGGYSMTQTTKQAPAGSRVTEEPDAITGFTYQPAVSANSRVVASNGSTVLRLYYNRNLHTVDFVAVGSGTLAGPAGYTVRYGTLFGTLQVPTPQSQPGYKFDGWRPTLPDAAQAITQNATYEAVFVRDEAQWATITLDGNGDDGGATRVYTDQLVGSTFTLPPNPFARQDYDFINWDASRDGTGASYGPEEAFTVAGDLTLYAQWVEEDQFGIVYLNNGGTGEVFDPDSPYYEDDPVTVLENRFAYPGYTFTEWLDQDGVSYRGDGTDSFVITKHMVMTAQWEKNPTQWANIVYDKNDPGAEGDMPEEEALAGEEHVLATNLFTLENHRFTGWNEQADGGGPGYADEGTVTPQAGVLQLYAQWEELPKYSITYHANNLTNDMQEDEAVYAGTPHTIRPGNTFAYEDHDFRRWDTEAEGNGTTYLPGNEVNLTGSIDLYAIWAPRRLYTITYFDGFGSGSFSEKDYADDDGFLDFTVAENPFVRFGYNFTSWESDADVVAYPRAVIHDMNRDLAFTAQWAPVEYAITYELDGGYVNGVNPTRYTIESETFQLVNPTRPGYTFTGWSGSGLSGETQAVRIVRGQTGHLRFTANWERDPSQWTSITFVSEDESKGTLEGTLRYEGVIGETIGFAARLVSVAYPTPAPAQGYVFSHWSEPVPGAFPEEDLVITAYWVLEDNSTPGGGDGGPSTSGGDGGPSNPDGGDGGTSIPDGGSGADGGTRTALAGIVATGDSSSLWLPVALAIMAAACALLLLAAKRRRT